MDSESKSTCVPCCKKVINTDEGLQCDGPCDRWFHRTCVGISKADYLKIAGDNAVKWFCTRVDCNTAPSVSSLNTILSALAQKIDDLSAKVDRLNDLPENVKRIQDDVKAIHDKFEQLEPRIERLEHRVSDIESRVDARLAEGSGFEETLMEINDRNKRLCNIILHGIAESSQSNTESKRKHDRQQIKQLLSDVHQETNLESIKFFRIGVSKKNNSRPIKVIFPNADQARIFSKRFSDKYANEDGGISMSRDRTVKERNYLQKLRADLEVRKNAGENDLTIRYINGVPSISKLNSKNA